MKEEFKKGLVNTKSDRTKTLLTKRKEMILRKRNLKGLTVDDIVAFANSPIGGTIFVDVDEMTDNEGIRLVKLLVSIFATMKNLRY